LTARAVIALLIFVGAAACSLENQEQPALSGPSGLGLNVTMTATPDQLQRDGESQSMVRLTARDAKGDPVGGRSFAITFPAGAPDGAALSQSSVVTDSRGTATFAVTAPIPASTGNTITVDATPVGTNADNDSSRGYVPVFNRVAIRVLPTNGGPAVAQFSFNPSNPVIGQLVTFDASVTADEGVPCTTCTFAWDFGGEGTASGRVVTHAFAAAGNYVVTLNVTDPTGTKSVPLQRTVTVTAVGPPIAAFTFTPSPAFAGQTTTFDASTSTVSANHRIVTYAWNWSDGSDSTTTSAPTVQHTYAQPGSPGYAVTLTVTDDLGQSANVTKAVTVTNGLTAIFTPQAPANPVNINQTVLYDGSTSTSSTGTRITNYNFDFGDGTTAQSSAAATAKHEFSAAGTYTVTLTITDEKGQTALKTLQTVVQ